MQNKSHGRAITPVRIDACFRLRPGTVARPHPRKLSGREVRKTRDRRASAHLNCFLSPCSLGTNQDCQCAGSGSHAAVESWHRRFGLHAPLPVSSRMRLPAPRFAVPPRQQPVFRETVRARDPVRSTTQTNHGWSAKEEPTPKKGGARFRGTDRRWVPSGRTRPDAHPSRRLTRVVACRSLPVRFLESVDLSVNGRLPRPRPPVGFGASTYPIHAAELLCHKARWSPWLGYGLLYRKRRDRTDGQEGERWRIRCTVAMDPADLP